ncbi:hypothetical protein BROUX41_003040 [Berkeleyomyces rouxiae]
MPASCGVSALGGDDFNQYGHSQNQPDSPAQSTLSNKYPPVSKGDNNPFPNKRDSFAPAYHDRDFDMQAFHSDQAHHGEVTNKGIPSSRANGMTNHFAASWWPRFFFAVVCVQAIVCLVIESYVFYKFQDSIGDEPDSNAAAVVQRKTIPTFLALFIFGFLYEMVLVWDALRLKNTIQVIGLCFANLAMMVYTAIQVDQIHDALRVISGVLSEVQKGIYGDNNNAPDSMFPNVLKDELPASHYWADISGYLISMPCFCAVTTLCMMFAAWKLYQEFAWDILKYIGADYRMKKRFLHYQIYIALLKFDFFFFLGFMIQFLVIVTNHGDPEFGLTIAIIPVTVAILFGAGLATRREIKWLMVITLMLYFVALAYFVFKLVRIYQPTYRKDYYPVKKSLTAFAVITIALILVTIINGFMCMRAFGKGLKSHLQAAKAESEKVDENSISMVDIKPAPVSRMTID